MHLHAPPVQAVKLHLQAPLKHLRMPATHRLGRLHRPFLPSVPGGHLSHQQLLYCLHCKPSSLLLCSKKQKENQEDLLKRVNEETMRQLRHAQVQNLWCCVWC